MMGFVEYLTNQVARMPSKSVMKSYLGNKLFLHVHVHVQKSKNALIFLRS